MVGPLNHEDLKFLPCLDEIGSKSVLQITIFSDKLMLIQPVVNFGDPKLYGLSANQFTS